MYPYLSISRASSKNLFLSFSFSFPCLIWADLTFYRLFSNIGFYLALAYWVSFVTLACILRMVDRSKQRDTSSSQKRQPSEVSRIYMIDQVREPTPATPSSSGLSFANSEQSLDRSKQLMARIA